MQHLSYVYQQQQTKGWRYQTDIRSDHQVILSGFEFLLYRVLGDIKFTVVDSSEAAKLLLRRGEKSYGDIGESVAFVPLELLASV